MSEFAKLYETESCGQILVKFDSGEEGPEVRFFFEPQGLGVCSIALQYDDNDDGWDKAESVFNKTDKEKSVAIVSKTIAELGVALK